MDVLCVGMPRAASTWQYQVACHLVERFQGGRRIGFLHEGSAYTQLRRESTGVGWSVLKAHDRHPAYAEALAQSQALALYSYRDLRDVAFSLMHKCQTTFEDVVSSPLPIAMANHAFWIARPRTLVQRYERLVADPVGGVEEIAAHLGIELPEGQAAAVADAYSLTANLWRTVELTARLREQGLDLGDPANTLAGDPHSLLHWNHIRDERRGGWRTLATPAQTACLARMCGPWLVENGYEEDLIWAGRPSRTRRLVRLMRAWLLA